MDKTSDQNAVNVFSQACAYHIVLQGRITPTLIAYLEDLQVREGRNETIHVVGWLPDQSALIGLLNNLNGIRFGILSVKALINQDL